MYNRKRVFKKKAFLILATFLFTTTGHSLSQPSDSNKASKKKSHYNWLNGTLGGVTLASWISALQKSETSAIEENTRDNKNLYDSLKQQNQLQLQRIESASQKVETPEQSFYSVPTKPFSEEVKKTSDEIKREKIIEDLKNNDFIYFKGKNAQDVEIYTYISKKSADSFLTDLSLETLEKIQNENEEYLKENPSLNRVSSLKTGIVNSVEKQADPSQPIVKAKQNSSIIQKRAFETKNLQTENKINLEYSKKYLSESLPQKQKIRPDF
jgi:hypothetical protein